MVKALESGSLDPQTAAATQKNSGAEGYPPVGPSVSTQQNILENIDKQRVTQRTQESDTEMEGHLKKAGDAFMKNAESEANLPDQIDESGKPMPHPIVSAEDARMQIQRDAYKNALSSDNPITRKRAVDGLEALQKIEQARAPFLQLLRARQQYPEGSPERAEIDRQIEKMNADRHRHTAR